MTYESIQRYFQFNPNFSCGKSIDRHLALCTLFIARYKLRSKSIQLNEIITSDVIGDKEGFLNKGFIQLLYDMQNNRCEIREQINVILCIHT